MRSGAVQMDELHTELVSVRWDVVTISARCGAASSTSNRWVLSRWRRYTSCLRAYFVQVAILANHQNDATRVRQIKIFGLEARPGGSVVFDSSALTALRDAGVR